ncbi:MAG: hypothetical protein FWC51_01770 [Proteobacteria bacterium]|nr:hypothetical protein [Pseudomonadota bacterium]
MKKFPKTTMGFYAEYGIRPFFWILFPWFLLAIAWRLSDGILLPYFVKIFLALFETNAPTGVSSAGFAIPVILMITGTIFVAHLVHVWDAVLSDRRRIQNIASKAFIVIA